MNNPKTLAEYLSLPYSIVLTPTEDGGWFAEIPDLPGCMTYGDSREEILELIDDAKLTWISGNLEAGYAIPEPQLTADKLTTES